jgi:dolichol-phosphate mannosyltransferase
VHLLLNPQKSGLGGAYLKGMQHAFGEMAAAVAFEFDADLSHDPSKIPAFLQAIERGADLVLGSRYIKGGGIPRDWGIHRKFLSVVGNLVIMLVLGNFRVRDWTTGFRAVRREVYQAVEASLKAQSFSGYTFQIGFLQEALKRGFSVVELPFRFVDRTCGESKLGPEYIKNTLGFIFRVRLQQLFHWRFFRFAVVGGTGALVQLAALQVWWSFLPYQLAFFLAVETAVVSNFIFNNLWTFSDRRLRAAQIPLSFVKFNAASAGSIVIQQAVALIGEQTVGLYDFATLPVLGVLVGTGELFAVIGIGLGVAWNFFMYTNFVWGHSSRAKASE